MAKLIELEKEELVATPPEGFALVFYTEEDDKIVKKVKLPDGSVEYIAEE